MNLRTLSADPSPFVRIEILVSTGLGHQEMDDMAVAQGELYHDLLVSEGSPPDSRRPHQRVPSTDALTCP